MFEELASVDDAADEAALVARLTALEAAKAAAAAGQARATALLDARRRAADAAAGIPPAKRGRGLAAEIALARRDSPTRGGRHLGFARALVHEMPHTLAALQTGMLSEWRATLLVRESACLSVNDRRRFDAELCADPTRLAGWGDTRLTAEAKRIAYRLDAQAVVDRAAHAATDRRVSVRPAPDCMTYVTLLLPVAQGVAIYAALKRAADTTVDDRSHSQVMADTAYERLTGRPADAPVPITVNLAISDDALLGGGTEPAHLHGYGPVPAGTARHWITDAATDSRTRATLRRLYTRPHTGALVAMDSRARIFPKGLATFIDLRDQTCRTPYCDAPIRHHDHARPYAFGGPTSADNALGECAGCNYTKETPGWTVATTAGQGRHSATFITPTGHRYTSTAPAAPGHHPVHITRPRIRIRCRLISAHHRPLRR
ncbi:HNH endonuclease [Mycobacterium sp. WMMD1722]|uniref:HNH endonuclease n=1 Tax=Mycobacterium sp. WMMD1722 TaxID=3404117 RepID=UPI003BF61453